MTPALVCLLWLVTTLAWWAFAFLPLPSAPPAWLAAARHACFGAVESGLPAPHGWMLLVLAPLSFLGVMIALWGPELAISARRLVRSRAGGAVVVALLGMTVIEGYWVSTKIRAATAAGRWDATGSGVPLALPADYPRRATMAPDFTLVDQDGREVSLRDLRGRPVVVSFVFAHCQTLCPLVVEAIKNAAGGAPPHQVLLVTLDPWRDTPSALPGLARRWGLAGNFRVLSAKRVEDVLRVVRAWDVPFERDPRTGDITHPGAVMLVDPEGRLAYTFNNPPASWIRDGLARCA